jgi:hypothetical protein
MLTQGKFQYSDLREAARDFFTTHHPELGHMFIKPYFEHMRNLDWSTHDDYVSVYLGRLFPGDLCSVEVQKMSADNFRSAKKLTNIARKSWLESHDELERCVKVRKANSVRN